MLNLIKIFLAVFFSAQYVVAIDLSAFNSNSCAKIEHITEAQCINNKYKEVDRHLNRVYKQITKTLPSDNKTKLIQQQREWLKDRDKLCKQYNDNKTKLTACYLDATISKVSELSKLDIQINKNKFEGKWESCFKFEKNDEFENSEELVDIYGSDPICVSYFLIENGENICGTWEDWASGRTTGGSLLLQATDSHYAEFVKICSNDGYYGYADCYTDDGRYVAFSDWTSRKDTNSLYFKSAEVSEYVKRTAFLPEEKEALIKENKWLEQCLNYKE